MKEKLTSTDLIVLIEKVQRDIINESTFLNELDSAVGDGDLGVTMTRGMNAVGEGLEALKDENITNILMQSGMNFNRFAASSFGTIIATALIRAGKAAENQNEIEPSDMIRMLDAAEKGIKERGKANIGDKTVLDALVPMKEAFEEAVTLKEDLEVALNKAYNAAEQGVENTKNMKSVIGRAKWLGERSLGHEDPGATAFLLMLRSFIANLKKISDQ